MQTDTVDDAPCASWTTYRQEPLERKDKLTDEKVGDMFSNLLSIKEQAVMAASDRTSTRQPGLS